MQVVKIVMEGGDDVRRLQLPLNNDYYSLQSTIKGMFPQFAKDASFKVKYRDPEGDLITIETDFDLNEALRIYENKVLKMIVIPVPNRAAPLSPEANQPQQAAPVTHPEQAAPALEPQAVPQTIPELFAQACPRATRASGSANCVFTCPPWVRAFKGGPCAPSCLAAGATAGVCAPKGACGGFILKVLGAIFALKLLFSLGCCCPLIFLGLVFCLVKKFCHFSSHAHGHFSQPSQFSHQQTSSQQQQPPQTNQAGEQPQAQQARPSQTDSAKYSQQQQLLNKLGFADANMNLHLLEAYAGDVKAVLQNLFRN